MSSEPTVGDLQLFRAKPQHADAIWGIINRSFEGDHSSYLATGQPGYRNYLIHTLREQSGSRLLIVASIRGSICAFADITINTHDSNFLSRIAVDTSHRGQGIATRMMREIQRVYGGHSWELDVMHDNVGARRMYRSLGFRTVATKKWVGRLLQPPTERGTHLDPVSISDVEVYRRFGFTEARFGEEHVLAIAGNAVRCRTLEQFIDDTFLAQVKQSFPNLDRAFIITDAGHQTVDSADVTFEIARSDRLIGRF